MVKVWDKTTWNISGSFCVVLAITLLMIPFPWVVSWCLASLLHELLHYLSVRICRRRVFHIQLGAGGAIMQSEPLEPWQEAFCSLSGPLAGVMLAFAGKWFPRLAICGIFQSLYNLLPIYPLDGGRAMRGILAWIFRGMKGERVADYIEKCIVMVLIAIAVYSSIFLDLGLLPLIVVFSAIIRNKKPKITCKAVA